MVQVKSQESVDDLIRYCKTNFGRLKSLHFHHNEENPTFNNFFIVEFESPEVVNEIVTNHAKHRWDTSDNFPVYSPILWLSNGSNNDNHRFKYNEASNDVPVFLPPEEKALHCNKALKDLLDEHHSVSCEKCNYLQKFNFFLAFLHNFKIGQLV